MTIIEFLRLIRKHLVPLALIPLVLASVVILLTRNPTLTYTSETTLFTGIASGTSIEMNKAFSYFTSNTAFDNLISVISSRQTQQSVAIKLLAQNLMLTGPDIRYISKESFDELQRMTPGHVKAMVVKHVDKNQTSNKTASTANPLADTPFKYHKVVEGESLPGIAVQYQTTVATIKQLSRLEGDSIVPGQILVVGKWENGEEPDSVKWRKNERSSFSIESLNDGDRLRLLPGDIDPAAYEATIRNLETYMNSSDTNFVYKLLYYDHPHYSIKAISSHKAERIASSDLVRIKFESDDPGICQQTLKIMTEECIRNFKKIKSNSSDAVVKYFENELRKAAIRLQIGEDRLLKFNKDNNIINYYEQSKAVAVVKENLEVEHNNMKIKLAGIRASIKRIEENLAFNQKIQLQGSEIVDKRNRLSEINAKIAQAEIFGKDLRGGNSQLDDLKASAERVKEEIRTKVNDLYIFGHTTEGLPLSTILENWIKSVIDYEDTRAGLSVMEDRIREFQKQYAIYAPAGANLKRIEREISVAEEEFLEILHGLSLAKLKYQDAELSTTIKPVDPTYFPLASNPSKRKILVFGAGIGGFLFVLVFILLAEYLDNTLRDLNRAQKTLSLQALGIFPKILLRPGTKDFPMVINRLVELTHQEAELLPGIPKSGESPLRFLFFSTMPLEGKSVVAANLALNLRNEGKQVLYFQFDSDFFPTSAVRKAGGRWGQEVPSHPYRSRKHPFFSRLLGYRDHRINYSSPYLRSPEEILGKDSVIRISPDQTGSIGLNPSEWVNQIMKTANQPGMVFFEIPALLDYPLLKDIVEQADIPVLVCRTNRVWSEADQRALASIRKITRREPVFLLNGVELEGVETILGDLPKDRMWLRRMVKNVFRLQFNTNQEL